MGLLPNGSTAKGLSTHQRSLFESEHFMRQVTLQVLVRAVLKVLEVLKTGP
jgi:hypothetical protein